MKLNVENFKDVLKKGSVNYLIPNLCMEFKDKRVKMSLISPDNNDIVFLDLENDFLEGTDKEEFELCFSDISANVKPYIDLLKAKDVDVKVQENHMTIKDSDGKSMKLFFCSKDFTNHFSAEKNTDNFEYFYNSMLDKTFLDKMNEVKKVATRFGKIYFIINGGKFYIESTDKTNTFCNSLQIEAGAIKDKKLNISLCFDFRNLTQIFSTIEGQIENFRLKIVYLDEQEAGMAVFENKDSSETYCITSKTEN